MTSPRVLVTNDDGVESAGLHVLADAASDLGLDLTVAAPCWDSSGASASLTAVSEGGQVPLEPLEETGYRTFAVHGAPAFIARAAVSGAFGSRPDVVLSGVNAGRNTGPAVLHSGTVGAALTAATHGCRALAVSAELADPPQWGTAAAVARRAVRWLLASPPSTVLNVNVPNRPLERLEGVVAAGLAPAGTVQASVTEREGGFVPVTFSDAPVPVPGTDATALDEGYVSVTALRPVCEDGAVDVATLVG
jgi:5'-nucleotidase